MPKRGHPRAHVFELRPLRHSALSLLLLAGFLFAGWVGRRSSHFRNLYLLFVFYFLFMIWWFIFLTQLWGGVNGVGDSLLRFALICLDFCFWYNGLVCFDLFSLQFGLFFCLSSVLLLCSWLCGLCGRPVIVIRFRGLGAVCTGLNLFGSYICSFV